jgi:hypothetical protein
VIGHLVLSRYIHHVLCAIEPLAQHPQGLGACGDVDSALDPIVAIASSRFGTGGNCDQVLFPLFIPSLASNDAYQWIKITNTDNGMSTYGKTRDSCPSMLSSNLSPSYTAHMDVLGCGSDDLGTSRSTPPFTDSSCMPVNEPADMSPAVFEEIGNTDAGLIPVSWNFQPMGWSP